jgi:hypothetical protein
LIAYIIGPLLAAVVAGAYIRFFAVPLAIPKPAMNGNPFLLKTKRKKKDDDSTSITDRNSSSLSET